MATERGQNGCCTDKKYGGSHACKEETCMDLPVGETCGSCVHLKRCLALGYTQDAARTSCDFFPRRFQSAASLEPSNAS